MTEQQNEITPSANQHNASAALMAALAKAQGEFSAIEKNREVTITTKSGYSYKFRYADLEEIITKTRPALASNGLSMIQTVEHGQQGPLLTCRLMHAGGGIITSEVLIPSAREMAGDPKAFGAAITYFRRYMVTAMLGVAADDDLDADGQESNAAPQDKAGQKPAVTQPQRRQTQEKEHKPEATATSTETDAPATTGEIAYLGKKLKDKGMTVSQAREAAGLDKGDTLDGLSKTGFNAIKAALA